MYAWYKAVSTLSGILVITRLIPFQTTAHIRNTGREWLIRSHSSARFCFELSANMCQCTLFDVGGVEIHSIECIEYCTKDQSNVKDVEDR